MLTNMTESKRRIHLLDEIRGITVILMVIYHVAYDLVYLFNVNMPRTWHVLGYIQPLIAGSFIVLSGISCRFSRSNAKRGLMVVGIGLAITAVTYVVPLGQQIWFGILHFLGVCMLLFPLVRRGLDKIPAFAGFILCIALFIITFNLPYGDIFFGMIKLPQVLYTQKWLLPIGFSGSGADYFPLFPWMFLYFAGSCIGRVIVERTMPDWMYRSRVPVLSLAGRHTLIIYILHQPVAYGLLWVFFEIIL